jgi:competence protein ComEC
LGDFGLNAGQKNNRGNAPRNYAPLLLVLLLLATMLVWGRALAALQSRLEVTFLDVGQGDCIIITSPAGKTLLIDGGGRLGRESEDYDIGRQVVLPALYHRGINHIDGLVATHAHEDHVGGLAAVVEQLPVGMILADRRENASPPFLRLLKCAQAKGISLKVPRPGQSFNLGRGITATVLQPPAPRLQGTADDENNNSIVIRLVYGKASFLFVGDLQQEGEAALLQAGQARQSTLLKVGHHGSMDAGGESFLKAVKPRWAIISVGRNNPFHHPHPETLHRLQEAGARVLRTDNDATIVAASDGRSLELEWGRENRSRQIEKL